MKSAEMKTLLGMVVLAAGLFMWLDFRDVTHDEISHAECESLNRKWKSGYIHQFPMVDGLDVDSFSCPSAISGLALGLEFLESSNLSVGDDRSQYNFWKELKSFAPVLGDRPGGRLAGLARYGKKRIDINSNLLMKGDRVEVAGVLIHEFRHLQEGFNSHVPCVGYNGQTCDARLEENPLDGGAYNYNVLFYDQVLHDSKTSNQDKRSAASLLQRTLEKRFNAIKPELLKRYTP